jgi:hypothetical protein
MRCRHKDNTFVNSLTNVKRNSSIEGSIAPIGSGLNLSQALAIASDGYIPGDAEIWVRSFDSERLHGQMSVIVATGSSLIDELNSNWHLACLACHASELEVELWG